MLKKCKFADAKAEFFMIHTAYRYFSLLVVISLLAFGCAKMSSPSGGPRDREIPVILKSVPENGSTNFTGREIVISFDEYVVLYQINEKLMVSPPMQKKPEITIRGKNIRIRYEDKLRDSTTYTFYFQDAIRDLNEGNAINNYQFVFSTGPTIDSLSVTGNAYTGLNLDPPENTLILLYSRLDDSAVYKTIPDYITRAAPDGSYRIDNVRPGNYRLYGLIDADNSKNYNLREEVFAFYDDSVSVTPEKNYLPVAKDSLPSAATAAPVSGNVPEKPPVTGEYPLILFQAQKKLHYLASSSRKQAFQLSFVLSLPPDSLGFGFSIPGESDEAWFMEQSRKRDSITVWLTDSAIYNKPILEPVISFPFTDTSGLTTLKYDTLQMRFLAPVQRTVRGRPPKRIPYEISHSMSGQIRPAVRIPFTAPSPMRAPDTSAIYLYEILKEQRTRIPVTFSPDSMTLCRWFMNAELESGKNYLFISDSAAFGSIYGENSDSTGTKLSVPGPESYGKLILDIKGHYGGKIIQLLNEREEVLRQTYLIDTARIEFPLLSQGKYKLRAVFDLDGNREWTTGDFDLHRQPEPVSYYPGLIEIKENWEVINPWELSPVNFKQYELQIRKTAARR
jgi:hypothetical protein